MKICTFKDCGRKNCAKGLCKVHYNMWKKGEPLHVINSPRSYENGGRKTLNKICSFEGCLNKYKARGWCSVHYKQTLKGIEPYQSNPRINSNIDKNCSVPNCDKSSRSRGYCLTHYNRWRKNGTTNLIPKIIVNKKCKYEGCMTTKHNAGYCCKHYREIVLQVSCKPRGGHNKKKIKELCEIDNCDSFVHAKNLCVMHYGRLRRHGDPEVCYSRKYRSQNILLDNVLRPHMKYFSTVDERQVINEMFSEAEKNEDY